jgi:hypothetical protein
MVRPFKKVKDARRLSQGSPLTSLKPRASGGGGCAAHVQCRRAGDLRAVIEASAADVEIVDVGLVGAVVGTYAGPGAVGCAYYPVGR